MREVLSEIAITAPPARVWEVLMDFDSYGDWNPFVKKIEGDAVVGERIAVRLELPGGKKMAFKPTVTAWESERLFQWRGKVGFRGVFDGKHSFRLSPTEHGTRFEHTERFTGILAWMMSGKMRRRTETGFRAMNDALKTRCEASS